MIISEQRQRQSLRNYLAGHALGLVDLDLGETFALPEPELPEETETLYDSRRGYVDQLLSYKNLRHGLNGQGG